VDAEVFAQRGTVVGGRCQHKGLRCDEEGGALGLRIHTLAIRWALKRFREWASVAVLEAMG